MTSGTTYVEQKTATENRVENRWRWWYDSIIDWMIANPQGSLRDCAAELGRSEVYVRMIVRTDGFKAHYRARREEFNSLHDDLIASKTRQVAVQALDIILDKFDRKRDSIPLSEVREISDSALARLGYGSKGGGTTINVGEGAGQQNTQYVTVSKQGLSDARDLLRAAESAKAAPPAIEAQREQPTADLRESEPDAEGTEVTTIEEVLEE